MDLLEFAKSGMFSFQGIVSRGSNVEQWLETRNVTKSEINCARFKKGSGELLVCSDRSAIKVTYTCSSSK